MVRVTGIDHLVLSVGNFKASKAFYGPLMAFLGFEIEAEYEGMMGWHNDKTLFWIAAADAEGKKRKYRKGDIGFHHYAFRLEKPEGRGRASGVSGGARGDHRRPGGRILR